MASDQGPVVQSALLRSDLVRLRKDQGLTQEQVAHALDWSPSKLIRIEGGKSSITRTDLQALLQQYKVASESRIERLQSLAKGARERGWWTQYRGYFPDAYLSFVGYEAGASYMRHFQGAVIPGLLQTEEYANVLTAGEVGEIDVALIVKLRMERQRELAKRESRPWRFYIIDEAVIRRHVGIKTDPAIMPNQLRHMADATEQDERVWVRVIPFSAGAHSGLHGPFTLLEFEGDLPDVLYLEAARTGNAFITDDARIADYRNSFESLVDTSLSIDDSLALIRQAADEMMA